MNADGQAAHARGVFVGETIANERICDEHYRLRIFLPEFPPSQPGQFVQLQCRRLEARADAHELDWPQGRLPRATQSELADVEPLLRRPLSLAGRWDRDDGVEIELIYRTVGTGTHWLATVHEGRPLSVLGPLGNAFVVRDDKPEALLVGGGVGIPPMIYLAEHLAAVGKQVVAFCGARSAELLPLTIPDPAEVCADGRESPCVAELAAHDIQAVIATDDGSLGVEGFVSNAVRDWIGLRKPWPDDAAIYCCGPEPLMKATGDLARAHGIECQLALERHMACGMGTCQSCVVKIRDDSERGWAFKLCCTDGPVFDARDVLW